MRRQDSGLVALILSLGLSGALPAAELSLVPSPQLGRGGLSGASLVLESFDLAELSDQAAGRQAETATAQGMAHFEGGQLRLNTAGPDLQPLPESIERELPLNWRLRLDPEERIDDIRLRAEWLSPQGRSGLVTVDGQAVEGQPIRVRLTDPWLVQADEHGETWEGGVILELPLSDITRSGRIEGELRIEIEP